MKRSTKVVALAGAALGFLAMFAAAGIASAAARRAMVGSNSVGAVEASNEDEYFSSPEACARFHLKSLKDACEFNPACRRLKEEDFAQYKAALLGFTCHPDHLARAREFARENAE